MISILFLKIHVYVYIYIYEYTHIGTHVCIFIDKNQLEGTALKH